MADTNPQISDVIIEYNHYLLKGDIKRKKELLRELADSLEPKRKKLKAICSQVESDFFYLVNNMNIRHNNIDSTDQQHFNSTFARMNKDEIEECYDLIYEQGLALYVMLEQQNRNERISLYKQS